MDAYVFISHSSADATAAIDLCNRLESENIRCWIAPRDVRPGADYSEEIIRGIDASTHMIILVSKSSLDSRYVRSEVALASRSHKNIFAVRIIDIEISGGLTFFLELNQYIDLFRTDTDPVRVLIDSIRNEKPAFQHNVLSKAQVFKNNQKATLTIALIGLLSILLIYYTFGRDYLAPSKTVVPPKATTNTSDNSINTAQPEYVSSSNEERRTTQDSKIQLTVSLTNGGGISSPTKIRVLHNINIPNDATIEISFNGENFQSFSSKNTWKLPLRRDVKLLFRVLSKKGEILATIDKTQQAQKNLDQRIKKMGKEFEDQKINQSIACDISGCTEQRSKILCNSLVTGAKVSYEGKFSKQFDLSQCETKNQEFCLAQEDLPFSLDPGKELNVELEFVNGEVYSKPIIVTPDKQYAMEFIEKGTSGNHVWAQQSVMKNSENKASAPQLLVRYENDGTTIPKFVFLVGIAECKSRYTPSKKWFADVDGRGLLPAHSFGARSFFIHAAAADDDSYRMTKMVNLRSDIHQITIAHSQEDGTYQGPWTYELNQLQIVELTAAGSHIPEIKCYNSCYPKNALDFFNVAEVKIGPELDNFTNSIKINFGPADFLNRTCRHRDKNCPPFVFEVPDNWTNVYSQIRLLDDSLLPVQRHLLDSHRNKRAL